METWTPAKAPTPTLQLNVQPRLLKSDFGDGYGAVIPDGLNHMLLAPFEAQFDLLSAEEAQEMMDFMNTTRGVDRFYWTIPTESSPRKFRAESWGKEINKADGSHRFKVTLKEFP